MPRKCLKRLAPQVGFEPTTLRLTAECSTIELLRSKDTSFHLNRPVLALSNHLIQQFRTRVRDHHLVYQHALLPHHLRRCIHRALYRRHVPRHRHKRLPPERHRQADLDQLNVRGLHRGVRPFNQARHRKGLHDPQRLQRLHCTRRNSGGTTAAPSSVASTTTGARKITPSAIRWVRSTASFHSSRKYPSPRACVRSEMIGMNRAHSLISLRIFWSQASPPRSWAWSNHTSTPWLRRASARSCAAAVSSRA